MNPEQAKLEYDKVSRDIAALKKRLKDLKKLQSGYAGLAGLEKQKRPPTPVQPAASR